MNGNGSVETRRKSLETKHQAVDRLLEEELKRPCPDSGVIAQLKKEKLRLKDQMPAS